MTEQVYSIAKVIVRNARLNIIECCFPLELPSLKVTQDDIALILCTSGTTGKSKGAVHRYLDTTTFNTLLHASHLIERIFYIQPLEFAEHSGACSIFAVYGK